MAGGGGAGGPEVLDILLLPGTGCCAILCILDVRKVQQQKSVSFGIFKYL
jgi:hypothetical protein